MAAQNLGRRLVAELKQGGKKTVVLGVLLLGGCYFWVPLVWKHIAPKKAAPVEDSGPPPRATTAAPTPASPITAPAQPARVAADWRTFEGRLRSLAILQPVALDERVRDPFSRDWLRVGDANAEVASEPASPAVTQASALLVCTSTMVGPTVRAAIINDEVFRIGEKVPREGDEQFVIKEIEAARVLVERDGTEEWITVTQGSK